MTTVLKLKSVINWFNSCEKLDLSFYLSSYLGEKKKKNHNHKANVISLAATENRSEKSILEAERFFCFIILHQAFSN